MIFSLINVAAAGPARNHAGGLLALLLLLAFGPFDAARADVALYQAAVPLKGATEADRAAAFGEALKMAVVRASGRRDAAVAPRVVAAAADPTSYVQQYSTTTDRMLKVGFDGRAIEQLLLQAGLPIWPAERPTTTVLLTSSAAAQAIPAQAAERMELERAAQARGVPIAWSNETLDAASARSRAAAAGSSAAVLVGIGSGGRYDWTFGHAGQTVRANGTIADGIHLAADSLAARYAPASTRGVATLPVRIGGLEGVRSYAALTEYLEGLSLVRSVEVRGLAGDTVQFELGVRGDIELLRRIFALDGRIVPAARSESPVPDAPDFTWQP